MKKIKKNQKTLIKMSQVHHFIVTPVWEEIAETLMNQVAPFHEIGVLKLKRLLKKFDNGQPHIFLAMARPANLCVCVLVESMATSESGSWSKYLIASVSKKESLALISNRKTLQQVFEDSNKKWIAQFNSSNGVLTSLFHINFNQIPEILMPENNTIFRMLSEGSTPEA